VRTPFRAPLEIASGPTPRSLEALGASDEPLASESETRVRARLASFAGPAVYVPVVSPPRPGTLVKLRLRDRSMACGEVLWSRGELPLAGAAVRYVGLPQGRARARTGQGSPPAGDAWAELIASARACVLPEAASAVLRAAGSSRSGAAEIARAISRDEELSRATLALANSANYRAAEPLRDIRAAVVRLGLDRVRALVLSASVWRLFPAGGGSRAQLRQAAGGCLRGPREGELDPRVSAPGLWVHAIACALCAEELARGAGLPAEDAFLAGLFHDLGKLLVAAELGERYSRALDLVEERACPVEEAEREVLGFSHARAGAWLLSLWGLPGSVVAAVADHHGRAGTEMPPLAAAVHAADLVARALAAGSTLDRTMPRPVNAAWDSLGCAAAELPGVVARCAAAVARGSGAFEQAGVRPPFLERREGATEADPILREAAEAAAARRREELFEGLSGDPYLDSLRSGAEGTALA